MPVNNIGVRIGAAAFILGLSLAGPQAAGTAAADTTETGSPSASPDSASVTRGAAGSPSGLARGARPSRTTPGATGAPSDAHVPSTVVDTDFTSTRSRVLADAQAGSGLARSKSTGPESRPPASASVAGISAHRGLGSPASPDRPIAAAAAVADPPTGEVRIPATRYGRKTLAINTVHSVASPIADAARVPNPTLRRVQPPAIYSAPIGEQLNTAVVRILDAASGLLSGLPGGPLTDVLAGALLLVRRGLFDQEPAVRSTQQLTSALHTEGLVIVNDPEGDPVKIELAAAPKFGTLTLTHDGRYLYTPGPDYAGADSFTFRATDTNGGFNLFLPFSDGATLHTVAITAAGPTTKLTVNLSKAFLKEVTGTETGQPGSGTLNGSYVYLYQPKPATGLSSWTKLIDNGQITAAVKAPDAEHPDSWVDVALKADGQAAISGGAAYLIVQSENPLQHTDLTQVADWKEAFVQLNVQKYNYGYTAFEYALLGQAGDQGDITYIPGFGPHVAVKVCGTPTTCDTRGLAQNATDFITGLGKAGVPQAAVFTYPKAPKGSPPYSPLDGKPSIVISPSNGTFGAGSPTKPPIYTDASWDSYLAAIDGFAANAMTFSGTTAGALDAAGIWHNGQYFSYAVQAVTNKGIESYLFSPDVNSQTKGYMLITQDVVEKNLYAPGQGNATLYESVSVSGGVITALVGPYDIPGRTPPGAPTPGPGEFNVSANNQWGNALTKYFTGFTAGNWGAVAEQANPVNQGVPTSANLAGPVDLNTNLNWDPAYAFDQNRVNTVVNPIPAYQHNDQYSFYFYQYANTYASAFSDGLAGKLNPGPQISLATGPGVNANVSQIDLYVFGSDEPVGAGGDGFFKKPVSTNYLAKPSAGDYLIPTVQSSGPPLTLQVKGFNLASKVFDDATIKLGIYRGVDTDKHAQFDYVTLPTASGVYQNFTIGGSPGKWTATAGAGTAGFIQINALPMPRTVKTGDVYFYQLVIADSTGANQRVFNVYATAGSSTPGELTPFNPSGGVGSANDPLAAIDNNAGLNVSTTKPGGTFDNSQITVNLQPNLSLPAALLTNGWDPNTQTPGATKGISALAAPVVGQLGAGGAFTAVDGQYGTGVTADQGYLPINVGQTSATFTNPSPTANVTGGTAVAFGWTGTNSYAGAAVGGVSYAPTLPKIVGNAITQAGQVGQYSNKILPGNTAQVTVTQGSKVIGTVDGVADLDGQWHTAAITLTTPGTYTATMTEWTPGPAGKPVVDYLGKVKPGSVVVTIVVK